MAPHAAAAAAAAAAEAVEHRFLKCLAPASTTDAPPPRSYCQDDFRIIKSIGHGDMGTVFLVAFRGDNSPWAMKVMKKEILAARENFHRAQTEKEILRSVDHPFLPRLLAHFETDKHTFLVTNYCSGGDLNVLRQRQPDKRFSENAVRFYAAEVLLALEYLHKRGIIYRDLKPENILVQDNGHVVLTDFDLSLNLATKKRSSLSASSASSSSPPSLHSDKTKKKFHRLASRCVSCGLPVPNFKLKLPEKLRSKRQGCNKAVTRIFPRSCSSSDCRSNSFVGTEEYVAPEVVWGSGHGMPVDWWTFGVFLYELVYAKTPFKGSRRKDTFYNILCKEVELPGPWTPLKDLISALLVKNPEQRLGSKLGAEEVRNHAFFDGVRWNEVELVARPPVVPSPFSLDEFEQGRKFKEVGIDDDHRQQQRQQQQRKKIELVKQLERSVCEEISRESKSPELAEICSSYDKFAAEASDLSSEKRCAVKVDKDVDEDREQEVVVLRTSSLLARDANDEVGAQTLELLDSKDGDAAVGLVFEVDQGGAAENKVVVVVKNFESADEIDKVQQLVENESNSFDVF